jgi:hypothetical protein
MLTCAVLFWACSTEIKRTAQNNGGVPLGTARFETETGIKPYDWERFWNRFGDAQKEAGFTPNQFQGAHPAEFIFEKAIGLMRRLGTFPTGRDISRERTTDNEFPSRGAFDRLGTKAQLAAKVIEYCDSKEGYDDIFEFYQTALRASAADHDSNSVELNPVADVYLFKSGRYYKSAERVIRSGAALKSASNYPNNCV